MKKTLVIGGSGFVGSSLLLKVTDISNYQNLDKRESPFFPQITTICDIRNYDQLKDNLKGVKTVVLLAAEHRDDVNPTSLYYDVNVEGTRNVLKAMDENGVNNLIFTSSVAVYGLNKINPNENHFIDPFNHYGKSKWQAEEVIQGWYENDKANKNISIVRPTVIFGERNRGNVYNLLKQISTGQFLMIGKGNNKKSMAYVGNIVAFISSLINDPKNGLNIYNYIDKPDLTMNELLSVISKSLKIHIPTIKIPYIIGVASGYLIDVFAFFTNKKLTISSVRVKKFCATTQFNSTKVQNSFKPPYSLEEGLDRTLKYEFLNKANADTIKFYTE